MHKPDLSGAFNDGYKLKPLLPWRGIILTASVLLSAAIVWRVWTLL
jgi:hypothetical protein